MQTTITGRLLGIYDQSQTALLVAVRLGNMGPVEEPFTLRFTSRLAFAGFAARHDPGASVAIVGELGQKWAGPGYQGPCVLSLWVQDHQAAEVQHKDVIHADLMTIGGLATISVAAELAKSPAGLPWWRGEVLTDSPNKLGQTQPGDKWVLEAFGHNAERLAAHAVGQRLLITWALVKVEEGTPILTVRSFRHLPQA